MISPAYVRTMAAYNGEMNRRLYAAAGRLEDAARRADRGAFWGSIHATLGHLVWGDTMWMSRFAGGPRPAVPLRESGGWLADWAALVAAREALDARITAWAARIDAAWLAGELTWMSGAARREMRAGRGFLVVHFFNHQTHHRGQAHALITAAGETTEDTDLMLVVNESAG
jgi:uncharacterized damage-inducible protein DinB